MLNQNVTSLHCVTYKVIFQSIVHIFLYVNHFSIFLNTFLIGWQSDIVSDLPAFTCGWGGLMFFSWHLAASLDRSTSPLQTREKLYLLAVGHYRTGDYTRSRQLLERCLEVWLLNIFLIILFAVSMSPWSLVPLLLYGYEIYRYCCKWSWW
jgi:hypothetical protein